MTAFAFATEVAKVGNDLIKKVPEHKSLADVRIEYVFRPEATRSKGKLVLGKARLISGLNAFLASEGGTDSFFVVEIAENTWRRLTVEQKRALVDHELCHFVAEEDGEGHMNLSMRGHDLEEFSDVIRRHGFWRSEVATFGSAVAEQLSLALDEADRFLEDTPPSPEDE